jgi:uncharacterized protein (TIGR03435 family)
MPGSHVVPFLLLACGCATAQSFDVASVKPVQLAGLRGGFKPLEGGPDSKTPTRIAGHTTMKWMVTHAFGVNDVQVSGPSWMDTEFFEIAAIVAPGTTMEQEKVMWQNLLQTRFHLAVHRESRELPGFALVVGKGGAKLAESDPAAEAADKEAAAAATGQTRPTVTKGPDGFPQIPADAKMPGSFILSLMSDEFLRVKMFGRHQTMSELAGAISTFAGRPVEDQTGLKGKYDFTLAFESELHPAPAPVDDLPGIPSLTAAVQEQLGLRLERKKSNVNVLVIDHIEKVPTEN